MKKKGTEADMGEGGGWEGEMFWELCGQLESLWSIKQEEGSFKSLESPEMNVLSFPKRCVGQCLGL